MESEEIVIQSFSNLETREIATSLESFHAIFSQLWQISTRVFNSSIKTACVSFDELGQVLSLEINPGFWKKQSDKQKAFILCHEMLHVLLEHGRRATNYPKIDAQALNACMDVVVNEMLVANFGFSRKEIDPKNKLCWLNTVFKSRKDVLPNEIFEYYMTKLPKNPNIVTIILDDHSKLPQEAIDGMLRNVSGKLSDKEKESLFGRLGKELEKLKQETIDRQIQGGQQAGNTCGGIVRIMAPSLVSKKRKWEQLIKSFMKKMVADGSSESWLKEGRRLTTLDRGKVVLPNEVEDEGPTDKRALVYFFLDTSGSCAHLADRFWRLAASVPEDTFDLRLRCFDTKVYEVDLKKKKLYGFGGTRFDILERHIQQEIASNKIRKGKYPDGVFVVTDGYGNTVVPAQPEKWHVLLTIANKTCFVGEVHFHQLSNFE